MKSYKCSEPRAPVMQGTPVPPDWRLPPDGYDTPPFNRWSFQNMRQVARTADIRRGATVWELPGTPVDAGDVAFDAPSGPTTWAKMLDDTYTDATLIWHAGRVLVEAYFNGMDARSQHIIFSMSKSVTSTLAGILMSEGVFTPDTPVTKIVPELARTAWDGATVRHVLDMTSGARFDETYDSPAAHVWKLDIAAGLRTPPADMPPDEVPATMWDLILTLTEREAAHGTRFAYRSIETEVLSTLIERATGQNFIPLLSERLWAPMGAEEDAFIVVDRAGFGMSDGGICATLRDMARFGRLMLERGRREDCQIVPEAWIADLREGDHGLFDATGRETFPNGRYRNMFWIPEQGRPAHVCRGIHGQHILIDPPRDLVAVKLSSWPTALDEATFFADWLAGVEAVLAAQA